MAALTLIGMLMLSAGCQTDTVHLIPTDQQRLEADEPLLVTQPGDEAWFWIEDNQRLCVAIGRGNVLGKTRGPRHTFALSLVLDGLPAGSGRTYPAGGRTLRAVLHEGPLHERYASTRGIVTVWRDAANRLSGRFRLTAVRHQFQVLTGWEPTGNVLVLGEFHARLSEVHGRPLLEVTERESLPRPTTSTRPAEAKPVIGPRPSG